MKININSDKLSIRGPKVDRSYVISFEIGEYEVPKLAPLLSVNDDEPIKLTIEQGQDAV